MKDIVLNRIVDIWTRSSSEADMEDDRIEPSVVWEALLAEFPVETIRASVHHGLRAASEADWKIERTSRRDNCEMRCCFMLVKAIPELSLDRDLVKELVYKCNYAGMFRTLRPWVELRLNQCDIIDAEVEGLRSATSSFWQAGCLEGLYLYWPAARHSGGPEFQRSLESLEHELRRLRRDTYESLAKAVRRWRGIIWDIRRNRPELPKPLPTEFAGRRVDAFDQGLVARPTYWIDRCADSELSIVVSRFEIASCTLAVEYECLDPALLPEDCPAVIEATVVKSWSSDVNWTAIREATYVHVTDRLTTTRPVNPYAR